MNHERVYVAAPATAPLKQAVISTSEGAHRMKTLPELLESFLEEGSIVVLGSSRDEFRDAELGLTFDGRMIYDYETLIEILMDKDGMSNEDAVDWVGFNILPDPRVKVV